MHYYFLLFIILKITFKERGCESRPLIYFIVTSQWPHTQLTIGYRATGSPGSPKTETCLLRSLKAVPSHCPSAMNPRVPASISNTHWKVLGTIKEVSWSSRGGYESLLWFSRSTQAGAICSLSWRRIFRPRSHPQDSSQLPTRAAYPAFRRGANLNLTMY